MKTLTTHMNEALKIGNDISKFSKYSCRPKTKNELQLEIVRIMKSHEIGGNWCSLNEIDTSLITDMSSLFAWSSFHGDISEWDVSNVTDMTNMFMHSEFDGDISKWDVSKVENMSGMFSRSKFNHPIGDWNVSNVRNMSRMFYNSKFNQDISKWDVSNVNDMTNMFRFSKFNQDISNWDVSGWKYTDVDDAINIFSDCKIKEKFKPIALQNLDV